MFDLKKNFATDPEAEEKGVWESLNDKGARIKVARAGNAKFQREYGRIPRYIRQRLDNGSLPENEADEYNARVMAKSIVMDWENLTDDGVVIPYSEETAYQMLKKYKDFRAYVYELALNQQRFFEASIQDDTKNSSADSNGTPPTD